MIPPHIYSQLRSWDSCGSASCCLPFGQAKAQCHQCHRSPPRVSARGPKSPNLLWGSPSDRMVLCAKTMPTIPRCSLHDAPPPWRRPPDARVPSTPRCTAAPMPAVPIKAGEGWGTCVRMAIPAVVGGDSCTVALATAMFWRRTARSFTASAGQAS